MLRSGFHWYTSPVVVLGPQRNPYLVNLKSTRSRGENFKKDEIRRLDGTLNEILENQKARV